MCSEAQYNLFLFFKHAAQPAAAVNKTGESISELILSFKDHCCAMIQAEFSSKSTKREEEEKTLCAIALLNFKILQADESQLCS